MPAQLLQRLAGLSILAALITIGMKGVAYAVTGSAGLLADALESGVNLLAASTAYFTLWYAARPVDATHAFGHEKIEFFASGLEGMLIVLAGLGSVAVGIDHLIRPPELTRLGLGTLLSGIAAFINLAVALVLLRAGRRHNSIVLEADGQHLLSDVYTTAGVLIGLGLVMLTGLRWIDPILAMAVGFNIMVTGYRLIRRSFNGLMDHALPPEMQERMREAIRQTIPSDVTFHALRTRQAGRRMFAEFHLLVPGGGTVREAHALAHRVESKLREEMPELIATIHIEPIDERGSWETQELRQLGELAENP